MNDALPMRAVERVGDLVRDRQRLANGDGSAVQALGKRLAFGGRVERVTLAEDLAADGPREIDMLALHEALGRMAALNPRQERIVELRYFGGLTIEETAAVLDVSDATVVREWTTAKAWLRAALSSR